MVRLINCYIENFGKISNRNYEFSAGLNCICEENGWGKSTLATFIRVMFYGFLNEKARKGVANERKRFKPWQGGAYGGKLTFETDGNIYEIERTFGTRENEDTYILRDKNTNLPSEDYTKNIGEELFKIDVNSFLRTVYISQNDCVTSTTDGINAKIGNLAENTDDINNFENVNKRLTDLLNSMSPTRKTGSIAKLKDEIGTTTLEIKNGGDLDKTIDEHVSKRNDKKAEYERLKLKQTELQKEKKKISKLNDERLLKERYRAICEEYNDKKHKSDQLRSFFHDFIPSEEELNQYIEDSTRLSAYENTMKIYELSFEENNQLMRLNKIFDAGDNIPDVAEIEDYLDKIAKLQRLKLEQANYHMTDEEKEGFDRLNSRFKAHMPDEADIDHNINRFMSRSEKKRSLETRKAALASMRMNLDREKMEKERRLEAEERQKQSLHNEIQEKEERLSELKEKFKASKSKTNLFALTGIVLVIVGIILTLIVKIKVTGVCLGILGILFLVLFCVGINGKNRLGNQITDREEELNDLMKMSVEQTEADSEKYQNTTDKLESSVTSLEEEIIRDEEFIKSTDRAILSFVQKYDSHYNDYNRENNNEKNHNGENSNEENVVSILYSIKSDVLEYKKLLAKKEKLIDSQYAQKISQISTQVHDFIARFYDTAEITPLQYENAIHSIRRDTDTFRQLLQKQNSFRLAQKDYDRNFKEIKDFIARLENDNNSEDTDFNSSMDININTDISNEADINTNFESMSKYLIDMKSHLHQYLLSKQELENSYKHKAAFEQEHEEEIADFANASFNSEYSLQDIDNEMEVIAGTMEKVQEDILYYNSKLNEFREKRDDISEKEEILKNLEEKYRTDVHQYKLIKATKELLEKARNSFTAKYMEPVMSGFVNYYQIIDGGDTSIFHIDAQTNLTVDETGSQRETVTLSTGRQDLIGICMRMALINAMYSEEKPFVVFDDPFVNLDEERVRGGVDLLHKIADEYQIIYFTCHESRTTRRMH